jgi:c-opsin
MNQSYIFYMFTFGLIVPMIVIFVSYFNILRAVRKVKSEINKKRAIGQNSSNDRRRRLLRKQLSFQSDAAEKRSTMMVAVMIGAFLIAWTPYSILALVETFSDNNVTSSVVSISPVVATVPSLFAKTSSVLNPIIYGFLNTQVYNIASYILIIEIRELKLFFM